jgi:D-alanyl-D-alanine carboxypeptidase/D-alanyl-D-alanine-endopeptidase (penicillin-binding protein 4)
MTRERKKKDMITDDLTRAERTDTRNGKKRAGQKFICWLMIFVGLMITMPLSAQNDDSVADNDDDDTVADSLAADSLAPDQLAADSMKLTWQQSVQMRIDRLLQSNIFNTSQVGMQIYDLTADSVIYTHNERQMMRPASTMKMVTAVTAIDRLGGSYQFKTSLKYTGTIEDKTLKGNLYCIGGFDPRFNSDDMNAFVESLRKMGIDTIRGYIYADLSMKDRDTLGEGWCWDDDNPVLSPLLISRKDKFIDRFISELHDAGIVTDASTGQATAPPDAYDVCARFHTIDQILMKMMKESDNLYAESMFYQIAASTGARPAKARNARSVVKKLIDKVGLQSSRYRIADGSGLSLYNYLSPELEVRMLRYAYHNDNIYLHLYPSLPIAGKDGTLRKRMRSTFASGNVHAKTGTVTGVSCLAGYCTASNGHTLCFSIMNQGVMHVSNGRAFQDRVCNVLCSPQ